MTKTNTALVLGATGGIGGAVAEALLARGWQVRALRRKPQDAEAISRIDWRVGDAMHRDEVMRAAAGVDLIVHAVNPPGYRDWDKLVLPMLDNTIAAATAAGATILLPGNVYNYGPEAFPLIDETAPQQPRSRKGAIRVAMERRLQQAAETGLRSIVVRAGDYFGPRAGNNWFAQALVTRGRPVKAVQRLGRRGVGHQWAYLPDVAETMLRLVECGDRLAPFDTFHMDGHWDPDGTALIAAIARVTGQPNLKVRPFPWFLLTLGAPFIRFFHEMQEMRYLWRVPTRLDNGRLTRLLGAEPQTPLDEAVRRTLVGLGCLAEPQPGKAEASAGLPDPA